MSYYNDKVVWITGASSGIGEELAYSLSAKGAKLVISSRRKEELERVKSNCDDQTKIFILPLDLADTRHAKEWVAQIVNKFGRMDILINNGGVSQRSLAQETPEEIERKLMEVNYFSTVNLTKAVLPYMLNQGSGQIVVVSSIAGKFGFYLRSTYSAAKHALQGYFESLRLEVEKKNIQITIVCPGKIKTNVSVNALTESGKLHEQMDPSHANAMSASQCANEILEAVENKKEEVLIGGKELKAVWLKRIFPKLFSKIIRKQSPF